MDHYLSWDPGGENVRINSMFGNLDCPFIICFISKFSLLLSF